MPALCYSRALAGGLNLYIPCIGAETANLVPDAAALATGMVTTNAEPALYLLIRPTIFAHWVYFCVEMMLNNLSVDMFWAGDVISEQQLELTSWF